MIALELAKQLKDAGLEWKPATHDFFAVPFPDLDHRVFVLADMTINQEVLHGWPALTFSGAMEWAMDYILTMEVVWIPTETQLREEILARIETQPLTLTFADKECCVEFAHEAGQQRFVAGDAADAYGLALLHLLGH